MPEGYFGALAIYLAPSEDGKRFGPHLVAAVHYTVHYRVGLPRFGRRLSKAAATGQALGRQSAQNRQVMDHVDEISFLAPGLADISQNRR